MVKTYRIELLEDHLAEDYRIPRIRVVEHFNEHYINTFADLHDEFGREIIPKIVEWCEQHNCGYRTSYDTFKFRTKEQVLMFLLRWDN